MRKSTVCFALLFSGCASLINVPAPGYKSSFSVTDKKAQVFTTANQTTLRLTPTGTLDFKKFNQPLETEVCVFVHPGKTFQSFLGIGGALTDASAETFAKLSKEKQQEFLKAYYDAEIGIGYTLARTNIHSCDFSSDSYTYVNKGDVELKSFSVDHDKKFRIPFIKQVMAATGGSLTLYASPWSPPAWMKDNGSMLQGGKLLQDYKQSWANYYVRFIQAYEKEGIPIWGLSVQNEPMAKQKWESCIFTAQEERDFIKQFLGPTLKNAGMADKKLVAWDHNRDLVQHRASILLDDKEAAKYIWGIGYHWYETWTGSAMQYENIKQVHETYPSTNLLFTEGSIESFKFDKINEWALGEKYGSSMINDFNSGSVGWTDWNVLLDENGGPNHVANYCFAPIIADTRIDSLLYTNIYYYIGQFSKFIKKGAQRIACTTNRDKLLATSFLNPDNSMVVVVMNGGDQKINYQLWMQDEAAKVEALPHSISTFVIK